MIRLLTFVLLSLSFVACGGAQTPAEPAPPAGEPGPAPEPGPPGPPPGPVGAERPSVTAEQCESSGGTVVGDIGDGATQRPDYVCPSGKAPTGNVKPAEGGPIAVEGSVCCPS